MSVSAVKLNILTWDSMLTDSLLEPQVVIRGSAVSGIGFIVFSLRCSFFLNNFTPIMY